MTKPIEIMARKRSDDPAQEQVREFKDNWNKLVKSFIGQLIACKRGMNGRGDPAFGVPPSNIKDPMPPEISSMLDKLAAQYETITNEAYRIIQEQSNYSEHRTKSQPMQTNNITPTAQKEDEDLKKIASWWGSRFLTLFQLGDDSKKLRRKILSSLVEMEKNIKQVEDSVLDGKPNVIHEVISKFNILKEIYNIRFIELYKYLLVDFDNKSKEIEDIDEVGSLKEKNNEELIDPYQSEKPVPSQESISEPDSNFDKTELRMVVDHDLASLSFILPILTNTNDQIALKQQARALSAAMVKAFKLDKSDVEYQETVNLIAKLHKDMVNFVSSKTNIPGSTLKEIYQNKVASIEDNDLRKLAAGGLSRWMRRKLLESSWSSDQVKQVRLDIANQLEEFLKIIEVLMDRIEKKNFNPYTIDDQVSEMSNKLKDISKKLFHLGRIHNNLARLEKAELHGKKNKQQPKLTEVRREDLTRLEKA